MAISQGAFPSGMSAEVTDFMDHFYHHSNASSAHTEHEKDEEHFASLFTEDGVYDFAGHEAKGTQAIMALRHKMFDNIPHRDQRVLKVFPHDQDAKELMVLGEVSYVHHSGKPHFQRWAGHYVLTKVNDELKFKSVLIIIDPDQQEGHREK